MMPETKFSLKKIGAACKCFKNRERATVWGGEKEKYGKRKKEGDLGDNK